MVPSVVEDGIQGTQVSVVAASGLNSCGCQAPEHNLNGCGALA